MTYLSGKCLLAMPNFDDETFFDSLIYICSHDKDGAFGFVINKSLNNVSFEDIAQELIKTEPYILKDMDIYNGGPLDKVRGFVLHSTDYVGKDTVLVDKNVAVSSCVDIISDIAKDKGPKNNLVVLGYASWTAGQLDDEIKNNYWLVVDADDDLLFFTPTEDRRQKAFLKLGVNPVLLSGQCGHA